MVTRYLLNQTSFSKKSGPFNLFYEFDITSRVIMGRLFFVPFSEMDIFLDPHIVEKVNKSYIPLTGIVEPLAYCQLGTAQPSLFEIINHIKK